MKPLFSLFLLLSVFSCSKEGLVRNTYCLPSPLYVLPDRSKNICYTEKCQEYEAIWKTLLLEKNKLDEAYFKDHIELFRTSVDSSQHGVFFNVQYLVSVDWASTYVIDQFVIKLNKDNTLYPAISVPRDTYLTKEHIRTIVDNKAFYSHIIKLSGERTLRYSSREVAIEELRKASRVDELCSSNTIISRNSGNFVLESRATFEGRENDCLKASIDLKSGETEVLEVPCAIN